MEDSPLRVLSLFQNEWTEAVDTGGCDGTPGANDDDSWRRESRQTRWTFANPKYICLGMEKYIMLSLPKGFTVSLLTTYLVWHNY